MTSASYASPRSSKTEHPILGQNKRKGKMQKRTNNYSSHENHDHDNNNLTVPCLIDIV